MPSETVPESLRLRGAARAARILALAGGVCLLLAVALYEDPKSFYTNFVLFPTLVLFGLGTGVDLLALVLALAGWRRAGSKRSGLTVALAVAAPVAAFLAIQLLRD